VVLAALLVGFSMLGVYALILRDRYGGLYEAISDESGWDIHSASGTEAVLTRTRRLHFLQNGVFAIRDYAWVAGDVLADYECSPGAWSTPTAPRANRTRGCSQPPRSGWQPRSCCRRS
jgi:hypothetical protein